MRVAFILSAGVQFCQFLCVDGPAGIQHYFKHLHRTLYIQETMEYNLYQHLKLNLQILDTQILYESVELCLCDIIWSEWHVSLSYTKLLC